MCVAGSRRRRWRLRAERAEMYKLIIDVLHGGTRRPPPAPRTMYAPRRPANRKSSRSLRAEKTGRGESMGHGDGKLAVHWGWCHLAAGD